MDAEKRQSNQARAMEKARQVCKWIYKWGYSTGPILSELVGVKRNVAADLAARGLLGKYKVPVGTVSPNRDIYYLTEIGERIGAQELDGFIEYPYRDARRVPWSEIWHNMLAQQLTLKGIKSGKVSSYNSGHQEKNAEEGTFNKIADARWYSKGSRSVAVEIELNGKYGRKLDQQLEAIHDDIVEGDYFFLICYETNGVKVNIEYSDAFQHNKVQRWRKENGSWIRDREVRLERDWTKNVFFHKIGTPLDFDRLFPPKKPEIDLSGFVD